MQNSMKILNFILAASLVVSSFAGVSANATGILPPSNLPFPQVPTPTTPTSSSSSTTAPSGFVTPSSALDSSANPLYAANLTSCLYRFNWAEYIADLNAGITNSNPYDALGCVRQENIFSNGTRTINKDANGKVTSVSYNVGSSAINQDKYKNFSVGTASTKTAFGDTPVIGIFPNAGFAAQAVNTYNIDGTVKDTVTPVDRSQKSALSNIYPTDKLNELCSTTSTTCDYIPRIPFTDGPDNERFVVDTSNNTLIYQAGYCETVNGKIKIRNKWAGNDDQGNYHEFTLHTGGNTIIATNVSTNKSFDLGVSTNPMIACAWPNQQAFVDADLYDEGIVKDQNLEIQQYVYEVPFPADKTECDTLFPNVFSDYTECLSWFQDRYSLALTGSATGKKILYTDTYYGAWCDTYECWVGWEDPEDKSGPRQDYTSTPSYDDIVAFMGHSESALRTLLGDSTSTYSQLVSKMNGSTAGLKAAYATELAKGYNAWIRGGDGYSIYAIG